MVTEPACSFLVGSFGVEHTYLHLLGYN